MDKQATLSALKSAHSSMLVTAVVNALGRNWTNARETLRDVANHGADAGFTGFTYCSDTRRFYIRHRSRINQLVRDEARDFGMTPVDFVAGFKCLESSRFDEDKCKWVPCKPDDAMMEAISRAVYGARLTWDDNDVMVANALAWFTLESVASTLDSLSS